jgi:hypothetical protein
LVANIQNKAIAPALSNPPARGHCGDGADAAHQAHNRRGHEAQREPCVAGDTHEGHPHDDVPEVVADRIRDKRAHEPRRDQDRREPRGERGLPDPREPRRRQEAAREDPQQGGRHDRVADPLGHAHVVAAAGHHRIDRRRARPDDDRERDDDAELAPRPGRELLRVRSLDGAVPERERHWVLRLLPHSAILACAASGPAARARAIAPDFEEHAAPTDETVKHSERTTPARAIVGSPQPSAPARRVICRPSSSSRASFRHQRGARLADRLREAEVDPVVLGWLHVFVRFAWLVPVLIVALYPWVDITMSPQLVLIRRRVGVIPLGRAERLPATGYFSAEEGRWQ